IMRYGSMTGPGLRAATTGRATPRTNTTPRWPRLTASGRRLEFDPHPRRCARYPGVRRDHQRIAWAGGVLTVKLPKIPSAVGEIFVAVVTVLLIAIILAVIFKKQL